MVSFPVDFQNLNTHSMVSEQIDTVCLSAKVLVPHELYPRLEELYRLARSSVRQMLKDRTKTSSKYYPEIPCVLAKSLVRKYQRNHKLQSVRNLVLPVCGDKGRQVKLEKEDIRVPAFFKKQVIPVQFRRQPVGNIRNVEFFKRDKQWYVSLQYDVLKLPQLIPDKVLGVDRNSVGNVATVACTQSGLVRIIGQNTAKLKANYRNRRRRLQKQGKFKLLSKMKRKQSRRLTDINHKVSRTIVDLARKTSSAIALENLQNIRKGKARKYVEKSQWGFYQLEQFILYKAALSGLSVLYVDPAYTSQMCSRCGTINKPNGKHYKCVSCGKNEQHRDVNAAFNIARRGLDAISNVLGVGSIGGALAGEGVRA